MSSTAVFLAIAALAFLIFALHPFLTYPISMFLFARRRRPWREVPGSPKPSCAICMSAYNEEQVIVSKVEQLIGMAAAYGPATVHIYADGCSDRTVELLQPYRDQIDLIVSPIRSGKTHGLNILLDRCDSDLLMFTDANVGAGLDTLEILARPFQDPAVGCTTAKLVYSNPGESATSFIGALYWRIEEAIKQVESDTVGVLGVDGASFVVRRKLYHPAPPELIDDLYTTLGILTSGSRVLRMADAVVYERSAVKPREEFHRKVRIACQAMNVHRVLRPEMRKQPFLVRYAYTSHRVMKWLMPFFVLGAGLSLLGAVTAQFGWVAGAAAIAAGALVLFGGAIGVPGLSIAYSTSLALSGVALGILQSVFGKQLYRTWEPAMTIRQEPGFGAPPGRANP